MMFRFAAPPPLSLYIHIPWCVRKCPYCDFNSHEVRDGIPEPAYLAALTSDLEQELPRIWGRTVDSVFIGGGTPSLFSPAAIDRLLTAVRARLPLKPDAEITLEANPGTVDRERFAGFREAGVNRLSIGVQSFQPGALQAIGRIHSGREADAAIGAAQRAGFDNINLDLMFGLPGQDRQLALADLRTAIEREPAHISWYELTIEPNTWFYRHPPARPDDDALWEMQQAGLALLGQHGYTRYEISAHARPGSHCRHNVNYWLFGDYLGIGAGAHGKITDAADGAIHRTAKPRHPREYIEACRRGGPAGSRHRLGTDDALLEFAMNALRMDAGFTSAAFTERTGLPADTLDPPVAAAIGAGLLERVDGHVRCTRRGRRYLNELLQYFMKENRDAAGNSQS
jgi:putative oxygen-independent coproporphyrinogen III oxidase